MKKVVDWFLLTSCYTACCAAGLCMATERLINNQTPNVFEPLHIFIFGCTLVVYNLHLSVKKMKLRARKKVELSSPDHPLPNLFFSAAGLIMVSCTLRFLSPEIIGVCLVSGFVSFAYSLPLLPFKSLKRIRELGWLKILDLAVVWTVVTSVLPMLYWHKLLSDFPYELLLRFAFLFTLCILFDIRDISTDEANHINTLPKIMGLRNSYRLIDVSALAFVALSFGQYLRYGSLQRLGVAAITAGIIHFVSVFLKKHPSEKAYIFWGDGVMLVYTALVLLGS